MIMPWDGWGLTNLGFLGFGMVLLRGSVQHFCCCVLGAPTILPRRRGHFRITLVVYLSVVDNLINFSAARFRGGGSPFHAGLKNRIF